MGFRHIASIAAIAAVLTAQGALPALALGDGPAIASDWANLDVSQDECFARGEAAIRRVGFGEIERTKYSRFGTREDYTVGVRCVAEKNMVLFMASGRDRARAQALQLDVHRNYLKGP
jgi:hypothetical protein